jgi:CO/xanthine dehydrogenase Mo-binding subunit
MAVTSMIGARIQRREDPKLITGHGHFVDDVNLVNMAHMSIVRSPYAHARIRSIDTSAAKAAKGVVAVLTAADFKSVIHAPLPVTNSFVADKKQVPDQFAIAADEVAYAGEPVAVVVADDRYLADDAAQLVVVDYEPLPAVMDLEKAMAPGSPVVKSDLPATLTLPSPKRRSSSRSESASSASSRRRWRHGAVLPTTSRTTTDAPSGPRRRCRTSSGCSSAERSASPSPSSGSSVTTLVAGSVPRSARIWRSTWQQRHRRSPNDR